MLAHCTFVPILLLRIIFLLSAKFTKDTQANIFVDMLGKMTKTVDERVKQRVGFKFFDFKIKARISLKWKCDE